MPDPTSGFDRFLKGMSMLGEGFDALGKRKDKEREVADMDTGITKWANSLRSGGMNPDLVNMAESSLRMSKGKGANELTTAIWKNTSGPAKEQLQSLMSQFTNLEQSGQMTPEKKTEMHDRFTKVWETENQYKQLNQQIEMQFFKEKKGIEADIDMDKFGKEQQLQYERHVAEKVGDIKLQQEKERGNKKDIITNMPDVLSPELQRKSEKEIHEILASNPDLTGDQRDRFFAAWIMGQEDMQAAEGYYKRLKNEIAKMRARTFGTEPDTSSDQPTITGPAKQSSPIDYQTEFDKGFKQP